MRLARGMFFRVGRIQWCDSHLCHVTGSDQAFAGGRP